MASFGGSIKLTGADEYRNALKQITQSLRETGSELTAVASRYDANDRSLDTLNKKTSEMSAVLSKQVKAYDDLKAAYDSFSAKVSAQAQEHSKLVQTYESEKQKLEEIKRTSGETSKEYQDQQAKVTELANAVAKSSQNMSENETALSKMRTQLNQAETTVNKTTKEIDELGNETEESGEKAKKGGEGYTVFKNILANLGTQAINSALNGLKSLGGAIINVGKQAVSSYAEFEQLEGGVQSMFGGMEKGAEQINKVMELSENAWKDLTMSQNDYITAFNSTYPLMKNDIEDQNEAIEATNRIMTLNSDLANTFGYSMETASNAINWALKGNYSYLDNLNIGIKGTKEGFLEAAQSVGYTVKSVDELSSSDILDVLEKCADKYGVLGKTADEASGTIQGSTKMMKASWQNLLTGMASGTGDIGSLVKDLVNSISAVATQILPIVRNVIEGVGDLVNELLGGEFFPELLTLLVESITELLPDLLATVNTVVSSLIDVLPQISEALGTLIPDIVNMLLSMLPQLLDVGIQVILNIVNGITQAIPQLAAQLPTIITTIINTLIANIPAVLNAAIQLLMALVNAIPVIIEQLVDNLPTIIDTIITTLLDNLPMLLEACIKLFMALVEAIPKVVIELVKVLPTVVSSTVKTLWDNRGKILEAGKNMLLNIRDGIINNLSELMTKVKEIPQKAKDWILEGIQKLKDVGDNFVKGIWEGISNGLGWIKGKLKEWVGNVVDFCKKILGIKSPSKVMADQVGTYMAEGIGMGFADEMQNVEKQMQDAIPTSFDTDLSVNGALGSIGSGSSSYDSMLNAFKEALSDMKIELDDEIAGKFVERTVARAIYN